MDQLRHLASHAATSKLALAIPLLAILSGITYYLIWTPIYNIFFHPLSKVPGPWWNAVSGVPRYRRAMSGQAHRHILELHRRYGDVVRVAPDEVSFAGPQAWRDIMGHRREGEGENAKERVFYRHATNPRSIIALSRSDHGRVRRILGPAFSGQAVMNQEALVREHIDMLMARLAESSAGGTAPVDLVRWFNWATFDIIGDLGFGEPFGCLRNADYHPWVSLIFDTVKFATLMTNLDRLPWMAWLRRLTMGSPLPPDLPRKMAWHREMSAEKVRKRIALGSGRDDFLEPMISKGNDSLKKMDFDEIRGTATTLIVAGSETSATTLSSVVFYLTTSPAALKRLNDEVRSAFASEAEIDFAGVQKLRYLTAVIDEALRLHPPIPTGFPREARPGGAVICDYYMPEGTVLGITQWSTYHNPRNFALPDSFVPERWLEEDPRFADDRRDVFQPFSFGPRNCIGRNLAYAEMRTILARIIWKFDLRLSDDSKTWEDDQETWSFWDKGPLNVFLTPRSVS